MNKHLLKVLTERVNTSLYQSDGVATIKDELPLKWNDPELLSKLEVIREITPLFDEFDDLYTLLDDATFTPSSVFGVMVVDSIFRMNATLFDVLGVDPEQSAPYVVEEVTMLLRDHDSEACLVGGCVRDTLIGETPKDFDFVSALPYDTLVELFKSKGFTVKETGKKFLVMIVSKDGVDCEIANFRKDGTYTDGRRPDEVSIGTIEEDAARRDFSVNALYFNLKSNTLIDPTAYGIQHIKEKKLAFVGAPKDRIMEDSLRVFRFYRFLSKGFTPDKQSLSTCRRYFKMAMDESDPERVRNELEKIVL